MGGCLLWLAGIVVVPLVLVGAAHVSYVLFWFLVVGVPGILVVVGVVRLVKIRRDKRDGDT